MPDAKAFLDTNVLIYAQDRDSPAKRSRGRALIEALGDAGTGVISTQVMQEFYVAATRKLDIPPLSAKALLKTFRVFEVVQTSPDLVDDAIDCSILNRLSFWDSLLLTAASAAGCTVLYSEDLNAGQTILGVRVENPFV
jgi:predicted nucleic acid-binding protein